MSSLFKGLSVLCAAVLLSGSVAGADVPSFNKRGEGDKGEKKFVEKVAETIVQEARSSAKDINLEEYKLKDVADKEGRKTLTFSASYKGAVTKTKYTADIVVHIDSSNKEKWEVLRIEYKDDNKSPVGYSRKKVDALVDAFNKVK
jgi:hypothetical protein